VTPESIIIELDRDVYDAGEFLTGRYRLDPRCASFECQVEILVFWQSMGKGETDRGVQHRESRTVPDGETTDSLGGGFSILLPASPVTYNGVLIKIAWCLEIRVHAGRDLQREAAIPFQLGHVGPVAEVTE
jgi:hypothetical protein